MPSSELDIRPAASAQPAALHTTLSKHPSRILRSQEFHVHWPLGMVSLVVSSKSRVKTDIQQLREAIV